jgi:hypothetical protein
MLLHFGRSGSFEQLGNVLFGLLVASVGFVVRAQKHERQIFVEVISGDDKLRERNVLSYGFILCKHAI